MRENKTRHPMSPWRAGLVCASSGFGLSGAEAFTLPSPVPISWRTCQSRTGLY